jgi:DNA-directed RNA polymerase specialized sigma24 family protein
MECPNWADLEHALEASLGLDAGSDLLRLLQKRVSGVTDIVSWSELARSMLSKRSSGSFKDGVLCGLGRGAGRAAADLRASAFLFLFLPGLRALFSRARSWDSDAEDLWEEIVVTFLEAVEGFRAGARAERVAQKLMGDTLNRLYRRYLRRWREQGWVPGIDPVALDTIESVSGGIDEAGIELRETRESQIRALHAAVEAGAVRKRDVCLIVATALYGEPVAAFAQRAGVAYATMKKRRQRALAAFAAWVKSRP